MGFNFGLANNIDPKISLAAFCFVILFLIFFDYVSGLIEFFLERSPLYNRMLQMMYKELMLMGLVSFTIIMYEAAEGDSGESIVAIDFAHITLFYMTLFFVVHSFYLMGISIVNERKYRKIGSEDLIILQKKIENHSKNPIWKFFFYLDSWPFSKLRHHVEFHLLNTLFHNTYLLSESFDFATYLSLSFGRYALKTINRSLFSWIILALILFLNYIRIFVGFGCQTNTNSSKSDDVVLNNFNCQTYTVRMFVFAGIIFALYIGILIYVSHFYKKRMLRFGGVRGPNEYLQFLEQRQHQIEDHKKNGHYDHSERYPNHELKEEIEFEMHSSEHAGEEEEPEIKLMAYGLTVAVKYASDMYFSIRLALKQWIRNLLSTSHVEKVRKESSILEISIARMPTRISNVAHHMASRMSIIGGRHSSLSSGNWSRHGSVEGGHENFHGSRNGSINNGYDHSHTNALGGYESHSRHGSVERGPNSFISMNPSLSHLRTTFHSSFFSHHDSKSTVHDSHISSPKHATIAAKTGEPENITLGETTGKRGSILQRATEFIQHPVDSIKARLPSFHIFHQLGEQDLKKIPLKHRLTFKFAKTAKKNTSVSTYHFQERLGTRSSVVAPIEEKSNTDDKGDVEMGQLKEGNLRFPSEIDKPPCLITHRNTNSVKSIGETAVTSEAGGERDDSPLEDSPSLLQSLYSVVTSFPFYSSNIPKIVPFPGSNNTSATSSKNPTPKNQNNMIGEINDPKRYSIHQVQLEELEKFKATTDNVGHEFHTIFLFQKPIYYQRAVELTILFNCLYMSMWATNIISIVDNAGFSKFWLLIVHIVIVLPILWGFFGISCIAETCSMLIAMSDLNLIVIHDVLAQMELIEYITEDVRQQFIYIREEVLPNLTNEEYITNLFNEIDEDGSGFIDADELRQLFKKLHLTFSNYRFKLLYRALDCRNKGRISREDLQEFIFPKEENKTIPSFLLNPTSHSPAGFGTPPLLRSRTNSEDVMDDTSGKAPSNSGKATTVPTQAMIAMNRRKRFTSIRIQKHEQSNAPSPPKESPEQQLQQNFQLHSSEPKKDTRASILKVPMISIPAAEPVTPHHPAPPEMQVIREEDENEEEGEEEDNKVKDVKHLQSIKEEPEDVEIHSKKGSVSDSEDDSSNEEKSDSYALNQRLSMHRTLPHESSIRNPAIPMSYSLESDNNILFNLEEDRW